MPGLFCQLPFLKQRNCRISREGYSQGTLEDGGWSASLTQHCTIAELSCQLHLELRSRSDYWQICTADNNPQLCILLLFYFICYFCLSEKLCKLFFRDFCLLEKLHKLLTSQSFLVTSNDIAVHDVWNYQNISTFCISDSVCFYWYNFALLEKFSVVFL